MRDPLLGLPPCPYTPPEVKALEAQGWEVSCCWRADGSLIIAYSEPRGKRFVVQVGGSEPFEGSASECAAWLVGQFPDLPTRLRANDIVEDAVRDAYEHFRYFQS